MSIIISNKNLDEFIRNSSIYTTGGGLDIKTQLESLKPIRRKLNVSLLQPEEMDDDSVVCSVTEIGKIGAPPLAKRKIIPQIILKLEKLIGKEISAFFPPEVGQESILLESAHYASLPVVDFDPVGFRAVPFVDVNVACLLPHKRPFTPAVVITDRGEIIVLEKSYSYKESEKILRRLTTKSKEGIILVLGEITDIKTIKTMTNNQSISYHKILEDNIYYKNAEIQLLCTVTNLREFKHTGFFCQIADVITNENEKMTLCILNEAVLLYDQQKKLVAKVPQRILMLDKNKAEGVSSLDLKAGKVFRLFVIPPEPQWNTAKGRRIFGPNRFRFFRKYL